MSENHTHAAGEPCSRAETIRIAAVNAVIGSCLGKSVDNAKGIIDEAITIERYIREGEAGFGNAKVEPKSQVKV